MKKIISFLMVVTLFISCINTTAFAETNQDNNDKIDELLEQRAEFICLEKYDELKNIDLQLESLGVEQLTPQQVAEKFMSNGGITPYVSTPTSNNVTWLSNRTTYEYDGKTYEIQTLTAQPNEKSSNLKNSGSKAISSTYKWKAGSMNALKAIGSSVAGEIPGASLTLSVYDTVSSFITGISKTTEISSAEIVYSYAHTTTVTFKYVKVKGQSDNYQSLSYISTKGTTAIGYQYPTFTYSGGVAQPNIVQGSRTINSTPTGYNSNLNAIKAYTCESTTTRAYVSSVTITGIESKSVAKISPLCPQFPAHIY